MNIEKIPQEYRASLMKVFDKIDSYVRRREISDREGILMKARMFQTYKIAGKVLLD